MTDEPTQELEQRLRADLAEIADAVPVAESPAPATNVVPLTAAWARRRRPALAVAGGVGAAAALLVGVLIWPSDGDPAETVATQDPATVPEITEPAPVTRAPRPTVPPVTTMPEAVLPQTCPGSLPGSLALDGVSVRGETLFPGDGPIPSPAADFFEIDEGGTESVRGVVGGVQGLKGIYQVSETFQVATAVPVRPVIDFVGERVAQEGPILLWWAAGGRVEAWISADGCDTFGLSVTGGSRDQNALAASELAFIVVDKAGLDTTQGSATDCPDPRAEPGNRPALFFYCPFDDVDQIPRAVAPRDPNLFLSTPAQALQALFSTDPPPGWGTGIPLVMRGADVDVVVTDGVAQVTMDYDFEGAPINNFSTSHMSIAYGNQLQATLFQFPEIQAIDLDTLCCGEWGGLVTRADWEFGLAQATDP